MRIIDPLTGKSHLEKRRRRYHEPGPPRELTLWLDRLTVREGERVRRRFRQPGGGHDRNVLTMKALRAMIDSIPNNPVRRGRVARPEDWE